MKANCPTSNTGYIMYDSKIQAITINKIYVMSDKTMHTFANVGGKNVQIPLPTIYPTENDCANKTDHVPVLSRYVSFKNIIGNKSAEYIYYWTKEGIKGESVTEQEYTLIPVRVGSQLVWEIYLRIDGVDRIYSSEQLAQADRDFEVIEQDGSSHLRKSITSRLALNETQQKLFDNLIESIKACNEANIQLIFHNYDNEISAYNKDKSLDITYSYEADNDEQNALEALIPQSHISVNMYGMGEEDHLWICEKK